ncbi:MAG TPA: hypothetical protein VEC37_11780 [Bacillota bacterium]|nr:hypothetical protein [Bacillota bacterium]
MKLESQNEFIRGTITGSVSATVICLLLEVFEWLGLAKHCWLFMAGQSIMQFKHTAPQVAFAFLIHLGVGSFWGIIIAFLFSRVLTERHFILKSMVIGSIIFFFHLGILPKVLSYPPILRSETSTLSIIFLSYMVYSVLTSIILNKLPH